MYRFLSSVGERNLHESLRGESPVQARLTSCEHLGYRSANDPHAQNGDKLTGCRWLLLIVWFLLQPNPAAANSQTLLNELNRLSPAEREKKLIEGAKKEGGVLVYSSENVSLLQRYEAAFAKRYPFIKVEFWRAGGDRVGTRVLPSRAPASCKPMW